MSVKEGQGRELVEVLRNADEIEFRPETFIIFMWWRFGVDHRVSVLLSCSSTAPPPSVLYLYIFFLRRPRTPEYLMIFTDEFGCLTRVNYIFFLRYSSLINHEFDLAFSVTRSYSHGLLLSRWISFTGRLSTLLLALRGRGEAVYKYPFHMSASR